MEPARAFATTLVLVEDKSGYPLAISLETKGGPSHAYVCAVVDRWLDTLGIKKCRLCPDGEPSIVSLAQRIAKYRLPRVTVLETTPLYSSASNGRAERTIQTVRRQAVCLKLSVELNYGMRLTADHPLWPRAVQHAS